MLKAVKGRQPKSAAAPLNYKNVTVNHVLPYAGERGNHLCLAQKHTENISCILSTAIARPSYALRLSTHGVTEADGGKKKYPLNTSQKKSFTH